VKVTSREDGAGIVERIFHNGVNLVDVNKSSHNNDNPVRKAADTPIERPRNPSA
jgi:hypothetical protein